MKFSTYIFKYNFWYTFYELNIKSNTFFINILITKISDFFWFDFIEITVIKDMEQNMAMPLASSFHAEKVMGVEKIKFSLKHV